MLPEKERRRQEDLMVRVPRAMIDVLLDRYLDGMFRATEWDARQWGFDPWRWFAAERAALKVRGGCDWPREVI
jgi:hypothetical protein